METRQETTVIKVRLRDMPKGGSQARQEAARLWNRMVRLHRWFRKHRRPWPSAGDFEKHFKGRFALHSQTIQALIQKFFSNIDTTRTNRKNGLKTARYPWREKRYFGVIWKGQAIKRNGKRLILPMGKGRAPLKIKVPELPAGKIVQAELGPWELRLTIKADGVFRKSGDGVAALDPGIIHLGVVTDGEASMAVVGRGLRSVIQGHNKRKAQITRLLSRCKKGSRRWKKLKRSLYRSARHRDDVQRNLLHHGANQVVEFCRQRRIGTLVVGDVTEINRGKKKNTSRRLNQENGNTPLGQFYRYLEYKLRRIGVTLDKQDEAYTTQQCPVCGHRHKPGGRTYRCRNPECGFAAPRDLVGSSNIRTKYLNDGRLVPGFHVPDGTIKYRRPVKLPVTRPDGVVALTWPMLPDQTHANAVDAPRGEGGAPVPSAE